MTISEEQNADQPIENQESKNENAVPVARPRSYVKLLGVLLLALAIAYVALLPTLRDMMSQARTLDRLADAQTRANWQAQARQSAAKKFIEQARTSRDPQVHFQAAAALEDQGNYADARREAEAALRLAPRNLDAELLLGDLAFRQRRYDEAIQAYQLAIRQAPDDARAISALGWIYLTLGWSMDAREVYASAARRMPQDPRMKVGLGLTSLQRDDLKDAEKELLAARSMAPDDVTLWEPLVDVYLKAQRYDDAAKVAKKALARTPNDVRLILGLATAYNDGGKPEEAARILDRLVNVEPQNTQAWYQLGIAYDRLHRPRDAIRALEAVARQDPAFEKTKFILGRLYTAEGRAKEGQAMLSAFEARQAEGQRHSQAGVQVSMHGDSAGAHDRLGQVYRQEGNLPRAVVEFWRASQLAPQDPRYRAELADAMHLAGRG